MNKLDFFLFVALYTRSVYCTYYHGPTAKPVVLHDGYLADTHEVAAAKNAHLAALGQQYSYGADYGYDGNHGDIRYHGPTAKPVVLHNGYLADTHEVAAAKNAHLAALGQQHSYGADYGYDGNHGDIRYHGPTAKPVVLHDGYLADTHEVAAAKNAHLAALGQQHSYGADYGYEGNHGDIRYHGPTAKPVVLHDGYLADTHEVAAAKNAHLAALGQQHSFGADYGYEGSHGDIRYHGPTAIPHVLHDGHIADTHEVASAREHHLQVLAEAGHH